MCVPKTFPHLQPDKEPTVRDHFHEEVFLVFVQFPHALGHGVTLGAVGPEEGKRVGKSLGNE